MGKSTVIIKGLLYNYKGFIIENKDGKWTAKKGEQKYVASTLRKIKNAIDKPVVGYIPMSPSPELMEMIQKALK